MSSPSSAPLAARSRSRSEAVPARTRAPVPLGVRLSNRLREQLAKTGGCLDRLELSLVHTLAAGAGGATQWRARAAVGSLARAIRESMTDQDDSLAVRGGPAAVMEVAADRRSAALSSAMRTVGSGVLPQGPQLDELLRWLTDTSRDHRLPPPILDERIAFSDAAPFATLEVIRHRVLRSAAVLERLPASLEVRLGRRKPEGQSTAPTRLSVPVVRLIARFPGRDPAQRETRVVLWSADRMPALVTLLRDCARRLDPRGTMVARTSPIQLL